MGELWLALFAYLIRNWKWLYFSCALFYIPFLIYLRPGVLPESPRWLISKGRTDEAFKTIQKAAKVNKVSLPKGANALKVSDQESLPFSTILRQLGRSRKLLIYLAIAMSNWFVVAMTTFGMKMNISHLGSNVYTSFTITVIADTLGTLLMFTMDRVGHKRLLVISVLSTGAACTVSFILILFVDNVSEWLVITFVMIGKLFNATEFGMAYTYTGELFPTDIRAFVLGSCSFFARIGSLASPYLYQIVRKPNLFRSCFVVQSNFYLLCQFLHLKFCTFKKSSH
ncbi:hypothetical protein FSP39_003389 [Pinctada imbricata]|uniref:Major facilitator superfamily (MFS) profile domain-containing protein n=1 Tax=Pinctada imbricata TaxID=66713 RepID=A0AA88Y300_PINIB|nr:hypothetical protein FSP39_003389 [Pinctada imbricata]